MFRFIHTADVHLDSPMVGLERYPGAPVQEMRLATRSAFARLVDLALDEQEKVAFVLIAGDLYDGDWQDFNTGLWLVGQLERLNRAGKPVVIVAGNHDAQSRMTRSLTFPPNVHTLASSRPESIEIATPDRPVVVHGQSYHTPQETRNLARDYPVAADRTRLHIGMLHTALGSREHAAYADCAVSDLVSREYQYWALGHVHQRAIVRTAPWIVFPGNLQGRHARETGPKGCAVVTVDDRELRVELRDLDVARWARVTVDATGALTGHDVVERVTRSLHAERAGCGLPLAVRLHIEGGCPAQAELLGDVERWTSEIRARASAITGGSLWLERIELAVTPAVSTPEAALGPIGQIDRFADGILADRERLAQLGGRISGDLLGRLPRELASRLGLDDPARVQELLVQAREGLKQKLRGGRR